METVENILFIVGLCFAVISLYCNNRYKLWRQRYTNIYLKIRNLPSPTFGDYMSAKNECKKWFRLEIIAVSMMVICTIGLVIIKLITI
jgi:hypothetical protein